LKSLIKDLAENHRLSFPHDRILCNSAVARIFKEGTAGFKGGLSAENYISITGTSRATATRDLQRLVEIGALTRTGERRHTRYSLSLQK